MAIPGISGVQAAGNAAKVKIDAALTLVNSDSLSDYDRAAFALIDAKASIEKALRIIDTGRDATDAD